MLFVLQKLRGEVEGWQQKVDDLNHSADKMADQFSSDDLAGVKDTMSAINTRWTHLQDR